MRPGDDIPINAEPNPINPRAFARTPYTPNLSVSYYQQKGMTRGQIDASYYNNKGNGGYISSGPGGVSAGVGMSLTPNIYMDVSKFPGGMSGNISFRKQF